MDLLRSVGQKAGSGRTGYLALAVGTPSGTAAYRRELLDSHLRARTQVPSGKDINAVHSSLSTAFAQKLSKLEILGDSKGEWV